MHISAVGACWRISRDLDQIADVTNLRFKDCVEAPQMAAWIHGYIEREREKGARALRGDASLFHAVEVPLGRLTFAAVSCRSNILTRKEDRALRP